MAGRYVTFDPKAEVNGYSMLGFIQCLRKEEIRPYLMKHGLAEIDPAGWYPVQAWLDVMSDLAEDRPKQALFDFVAAGMKVAETTRFPSEFNSLPLPKIFEIGNENYRAVQHRGGDAGEIILEIVRSTHLIQKLRTPYPDDVWYGLFHGICRRFLPPGIRFALHYDEDTLRRDQGGEWTLIHITWE